MGLDWFTSGNKEYTGPKYHRANGLQWVLEECGYNKSAKECYGEENPEEQLCVLSDNQMKTILKDIRSLIDKQEFPDSVLDNIDIDELNEHLKEAEQMLELVIAFKGDASVSIYADF